MPRSPVTSRCPRPIAQGGLRSSRTGATGRAKLPAGGTACAPPAGRPGGGSRGTGLTALYRGGPTRYHVYDGRGEVIASFRNWDLAHEWAHAHASAPGVVTPLEVDDRSNRVSRFISAAGCELLAWGTVARLAACDREV